MCGITGYVDLCGSRLPRSRELETAVDALHHRGPNDRGIWQDGGQVGFGHTRLSILDLSDAGHQPMVSRDGNLIMVFNGEVYNFRALRRELEAAGETFRGDSDSEVVLAAIARWGVDAVQRFVGMFAIAIWNRRTRGLTLVRDRLGVKPLYYGWDGRCLWFGSELKALHAFRHWTAAIDQAALGEYFQFGYINAPRSIFQQISKLPPAHILELNADGELSLSRYWTAVRERKDAPAPLSAEQVASQLEELLADAFSLRMVSDVPLGVFLSGGVDSSLVTAILQRKSENRLHTFTVGMGVETLNEIPYARSVARHLRTDHTEETLEPDAGRDILLNWGRLYDEPFFDSSGIPTYLVSQVASRYVKVVLSADGGDELFGGYNLYAGILQKAARMARLPAPVRGALSATLGMLPLSLIERAILASPFPPARRTQLQRRWVGRLRMMGKSLSAADAAALYENAVSIWGKRDIENLLGRYQPVRETIAAYPGTLLEKMCLWDLHNYLPGDILVKVDRASMAVGIEGREPLLDHRVVEFAFGLPDKYRHGALGAKHVLKDVLFRHVPRQLVDRPKQGFAIPLLQWLRGDLAYLVDEHLGDDTLREQPHLDPRTVRRVRDAFQRGDDSTLNQVWSLIAFQMWCKTWS